MSMLDEVEKFFSDTEISANYRTINLGGKFLYIEGIKNIIFLGEEEMRFQLKREALKVVGKNLKIKYLDKNTSVIEGIIRIVEVS